MNFSSAPQDLFIPRLNGPLISVLRDAQLATDIHYNLRGVTRQVVWSGDFLCDGDGSGRMTAALLRKFLKSRGIFNGLLDFAGSDIRGIAPTPPAALDVAR